MSETNKATATKAVPTKVTPTKAAPTKAPVAKNLDLPKKVFDVKVSTQAVFDAIMSERGSRRFSTHKVKHRGEVRGGGKKPFAQKHTGRARAGSTRSPIWVGGGVVFGPTTERNYKLKINKKYRKLAFTSALTLKAKDNAVVKKEIKLEKISTKSLVAAIASLNLNEAFKKVLIVTDDSMVFTSGQNLPKVTVQKLSGLGVEQIVNADVMIISEADIKRLEGMVK
ncbi:MAG: 50S ribosomal protein L4 [Mycoplasmatales bacterium]|nr:50S ribosomal protein L4 [Mycoplasmatales bacterium]